jgi:hypothetical protein
VRADRTVCHLEEGYVEPGNGMGPEGRVPADEVNFVVQCHVRHEIVDTLFHGLRIITDELRGTEEARGENCSGRDGAAGDSKTTVNQH